MEEKGRGRGCDMMKRDEWSEGAVTWLLEAYEAKWGLRNRAKLKGHDWEDVAKHVSSRAGSTKTQTQCKNKIESMKKRYRSESAASTWPLFARVDRLMRGVGVGPIDSKATTLMLLESPPPPPPLPPPPQPCSLPVETAQNFPKLNDVYHPVDKEERVGDDDEARQSSEQVSEDESKKDGSDNNSRMTPTLYESKDSMRSNPENYMKKRKKEKRKREEGIVESLQGLAEAVVKLEHARMETLREVERMRVKGEARRAQMDLKRIQLFANTQLQIARIFASCSSSNGRGKLSSTL